MTGFRQTSTNVIWAKFKSNYFLESSKPSNFQQTTLDEIDVGAVAKIDRAETPSTPEPMLYLYTIKLQEI